NNNTFIDHLDTGTAPAIYITNDYNSLTNHISVSNNHIIGWYYGIHGGCNDLIIKNNTIEDCKHSGIHLLYNSPCTIQENNVNCGIYLAKISNVSLKDNTVSGPCIAGNGVGSGIYLTNDSASYTTEKNTILRNKVAGCTYGVRLYKSAGTLTTTDILYNDIRYNTTPFANSSDGTLSISYNLGYKTENTGTATISASSTSVTISHGLVAAPTKIIVTPFGNVGNCWVDYESITATKITIHCSSAPETDTTVSWSAQVV
ncbi:MAG: NosD domain-containing protein, partial [Methanobacterium sp.]